MNTICSVWNRKELTDMVTQIIKRDGRKLPFNIEKIANGLNVSLSELFENI